MNFMLPDTAPIPSPRPDFPVGNGGLGGLGGSPAKQPSFLQSDGFGNVLQALGISLLGGPRNAPLSGFGQTLMGLQQNSSQMAQQQQKAAKEQQAMTATKQWLLSKGLSEADADAAVANPAILSQLMKSMKGGGGTQYGLNPIWGADENGNPALGVLGNDGTFKKIDTGGFALSTGTEQIDLGDRFAIKDKRSGEIIGYIPKENYKEAFDTASGSAQGKATAEAQSALPGARSMAALIDSQVESLKTDPYLNNMLGPVNSRLPNTSTDAARVQAKMDQLSGGAFLQARQMLKGGGAITDFESNKAEQAFIRMNAAQSPDDFKKALDEFNQAVQDGVRKLETQSGTASPVAPASPSGTSLKDKYGLD